VIDTMNTAVIKRSIIVGGRKTSISLENEFWDALRGIASARNISITELVEQIERDRKTLNLSSAIRTFVFNNLRKDVAALGSRRQSPDSESLRARGEECRVLAESFADAETRATLLRIADDYDRMADRMDVAISLTKR
jgi:predicted DNA-binding ribbon-helix-helix protein